MCGITVLLGTPPVKAATLTAGIAVFAAGVVAVAKLVIVVVFEGDIVFVNEVKNGRGSVAVGFGVI